MLKISTFKAELNQSNYFGRKVDEDIYTFEYLHNGVVEEVKITVDFIDYTFYGYSLVQKEMHELGSGVVKYFLKDLQKQNKLLRNVFE